MSAGWELKRLGDVCKTSAGGTPLKANKNYYEGGTIPWLLSGEVGQGEIFETQNFITEEGLNNSSAKLFPKNTVLVAMYGATAGQTGILRIEATTNQAVCGILPSDSFLPEFLYYFFLSAKERLAAQAVGGAQPNISQTKIKDTKVPVPPIEEQRRITAVLDEALAAVSTAVDNTQRNLQNAQDLFDAYLQAIFANPGRDWEEKTIKDICDTQYGLSQKMNTDGNGYKIFRMGELQNGRLIDTGSMKYADIEAAEFEKYKLYSGDVLFNRTNSYEHVGKTGIFNLTGDYCFASYLIRLNFDREVIAPQFLNYFMNSSTFQDSVKQKASRSINQANINATILSKEPIRYPKSLVEQCQIVEKLDALANETQRLQTIYQQKLAALNELKQALLHQAFSGNL